METTITLRQLFTAVVNNNITDVEIAKAQEELEKLDRKNANRSSKPTKAQLENAPIIEAILSTLADAPSGMLGTELAAALDVSTSKVSGLCRTLLNDGKITVEKVSVPKRGKQNKYYIASADASEAEAE